MQKAGHGAFARTGRAAQNCQLARRHRIIIANENPIAWVPAESKYKPSWIDATSVLYVSLRLDNAGSLREASNEQAGFGIVTVVIAAVIIIVIGMAGSFTYLHSKSKTNNTTDNTQTTNSQQINKAPAYVTISQWGVRASYSGSFRLSYTMSTDGKTATFSSDQLTALDSACVGGGGKIIRWAANDQVSEGPADSNTPTAANFFAGKDASTFPYAHIGDYSYTFAHAQAGCGNISTTATLQTQTNDAVKALVADLQATHN